jgi:hypothetical protein
MQGRNLPVPSARLYHQAVYILRPVRVGTGTGGKKNADESERNLTSVNLLKSKGAGRGECSFIQCTTIDLWYERSK